MFQLAPYVNLTGDDGYLKSLAAMLTLNISQKLAFGRRPQCLCGMLTAKFEYFLNAQESLVSHLSSVMIDLGRSTADRIKRHKGDKEGGLGKRTATFQRLTLPQSHQIFSVESTNGAIFSLVFGLQQIHAVITQSVLQHPGSPAWQNKSSREGA